MQSEIEHQFGLDFGSKYCRRQISRLVNYAKIHKRIQNKITKQLHFFTRFNLAFTVTIERIKTVICYVYRPHWLSNFEHFFLLLISLVRYNNYTHLMSQSLALKFILTSSFSSDSGRTLALPDSKLQQPLILNIFFYWLSFCISYKFK